MSNQEVQELEARLEVHREVQRLVALELLMESFLDALRFEMKAREVSQNELARRLGQTPSAVSQMLASRNLTASSIAKLAAAIGCRARVVLGTKHFATEYVDEHVAEQTETG